MADLQELFSRLKSPASNNEQDQYAGQPGGIWNRPQQAYQQPSVSSPIFSPQIGTPNPNHPSSVMSPALPTPGPDTKAANLLNLLRFNGQGSQSSPLSAMQNIGNSSRSASATHPEKVATANPPNGDGDAALGNPQTFLLNLLNQPKRVPSEAPLQAPQPQAPASNLPNLSEASLGMKAQTGEAAQRNSREPTPVRVFGSVESRETTPFEVPNGAKKSAIFTYVNPFEQLSASSPRHRTPKPERDSTPKVDTGKTAQPQNLSANEPVKSMDGNNHKTVSEALSDVGDAVDKQVEQALARADAGQPTVPADIGKTAEKSASATPKAKAGKQTTHDDVADSWESAEDSSGKENAASAVEVYNFPMKPFVSIELAKGITPPALRPDSLMDIARLKKEFDQIDRTLATASTSHIVYAMAKNGGFRVIRQDSGRDKQVFKSSQERVFNVQIRPGNKNDDSVLATGINGSVYWTSITSAESDSFEDESLEAQGLILPPLAVQDDNTSGSPVKTRSKMSSRHPEFFGISRGKSIFVIQPLVARSAKYADEKTRIVDNSKYFADHSLKITTGKACKDFAFSEDDSLIVSLDKAGRIKFWDIREVDDNVRNNRPGNMEIKNPLMTLTTSIANEKVSPTSVMFVDKERPCVKGIALRYLIVGLKQNHVLQLWDLGLNKVVQEIHFPHDKDSDAICSISYHPKTGIIALAHPTRNSIYFIHLSAPRYHIPNLDQAKYINQLATGDPNLPKPESTAIMSGIRELSFASKGQLRSIDMLVTPATNQDSPEAAETLFELYAMHSKGVTCLNIKKADLGWTSDNKVMKPIDAEKTGYIKISPIRADAAATSEDAINETIKPEPVIEKADTVKQAVTPAKPSQPLLNSPAPSEVKKATTSLSPAIPERAVNPPIITPESYAMPPAANVEMSEPELSSKERDLPAPSMNKTSVGKNTAVSDASIESLTKEFDGLYRKIEDNRRVQDAAASARQDAILRLVSSTLTDNVEKSLEKIVSTTVQSSVLPVLQDNVTSMLDKKLSQSLAEHLGTSLPKDVRSLLPTAVTRAMQDKEVLRIISEQTASKISPQMQQTLEAVLRTSIIPTLNNVAAATTQKTIADVEARFVSQLQQAEAQRRQDNAKIEQMSGMIYNMSQMIQQMASSQAALSEQIADLQASGAGPGAASRSTAPSSSEVVQSIEDEELVEITDLMTTGRYEEGTIKVRSDDWNVLWTRH